MKSGHCRRPDVEVTVQRAVSVVSAATTTTTTTTTGGGRPASNNTTADGCSCISLDRGACRPGRPGAFTMSLSASQPVVPRSLVPAAADKTSPAPSLSLARALTSAVHRPSTGRPTAALHGSDTCPSASRPQFRTDKSAAAVTTTRTSAVLSYLVLVLVRKYTCCLANIFCCRPN